VPNTKKEIDFLYRFFKSGDGYQYLIDNYNAKNLLTGSHFLFVQERNTNSVAKVQMKSHAINGTLFAEAFHQCGAELISNLIWTLVLFARPWIRQLH
jgi:hypothetical protein